MERRLLVWCAVLALLAAACGGTYHPDIPDQAVAVRTAGTEPVAGAQTSGATGGDAVDATTTGGATGGGAGTGGATTGGSTAAGSTAGSTAGTGAAGTGAATPAPAGSGAAVSAASGGIIKIGAVNPMSGPIGSIGRAQYEGAAAVFAEVNDAGGINGTKIRFLVEDDQFDPVQGRKKVQKLINEDRVFGFAGILNPSTFDSSIPDFDKASTPNIPTNGSADHYNKPWAFPTFQVCDRNVAGNVTDLVRRLGKKNLAFVYIVGLAASQQCAEKAGKVGEKLGARVVYNGTVAPAAPDCAAQMLNARNRGADAVILATDNLGVVKCVQARDQQGWDVAISVTANLIDDPAIVRGLGRSAEGMLSHTPYTGVPSAQFEAQCGRALRRYFPNASLQFFHIAGCIGARVWVDTFRRIGTDATRAAFIDHLQSAPPFSTNGLSPDLTWRPGNHLPFDLSRPVEIKNGKWVTVGDLYTPPKP